MIAMDDSVAAMIVKKFFDSTKKGAVSSPLLCTLSVKRLPSPRTDPAYVSHLGLRSFFNGLKQLRAACFLQAVRLKAYAIGSGSLRDASYPQCLQNQNE